MDLKFNTSNLPDWWPFDKPYAIMDCGDGMKMLPDKCIDLILTDPPYDIHVGGGGIYERESKEYLVKIDNSFDTNFDPAIILNESLRIMKVYNAYWFCSRKQVVKYLNFAEENDFNYDILFWEKTNPMPTKNNKYLPDLEYCIFMRSKKDTAFFNNELPFDFYRKPFKSGIQANYEGHPTPKPIKLIEKLMKVSSKEKDIVLDPFLGSGTTLLACRKTNRIGLGFEINPEYERIIIKRGLEDEPYHDDLEEWV